MHSTKPGAPIAIVGMAFRFPGDLGGEQVFWRALQEGRDLVSKISPERWATDLLQHSNRSEPGRSVTFSAGVLSRIDEFDADFFGISPREAAWLDPQQRLLLELTWEAMENGGITPSTLAGSDCAVYVGISGVDYGMRAMDDLSSMAAHSMTGNTLSIAANRLSHIFDLRGPSVAVDTACSSSLVALHHACNSLRSGESSVALVGGVNLLLHPYPFIGFTKASMLSATGRCRAFDASGDGYVRAEGSAIILLKPLDKALSDGDDIQAVILATGTNTDGGRKTSLTIPSIEGQAELMRDVLERSGLAPNDLDYIEAHGTGTPVGDPIEAAAIGKVFGGSRPHDQPLPIGSVKTNLGHLESASGMAGLVKSVLILKNRALPPSLHLVTPNPHIDFADLNLEVVTRYRPLRKTGRKKFVVGVNSFGFGGANAHALLQEYRPKKLPVRQVTPVNPPLFLSARTPQALRDLAGRYADLLRQQPGAYYDIAHGAAFRRDRLENRLAIVAPDTHVMADQLAAFARGESAAQLLLEDKLAQPGSVAFIYSGNGAQWQGMGQQLMVESSAFAEIMTRLDDLIRALSGFSIIEELQSDAEHSRLNDSAVAPLLLFAIQVALTSLLRDKGIKAQAVAGHSMGEVAAAWAAGALSLYQAVEVICKRSAFQELTRSRGRMAALGMSEKATRELIAAEKLDGIEIAGINSPNHLTLTGNRGDLERLGEILSPRRVFFRLLDLDYAYHSKAMDVIKDELINGLSTLTPVSTTDADFVSTVTGEVQEGTVLDAHYWWRNVRQPVLFAPAMTKLAARGCRIFVEIGPNAILQRYMKDCLVAEGIAGRVLPILKRGNDGIVRINEVALRINMLVEQPHLDVFFPETGRHIRLPNYPWQREHHWHPRTSESYALNERHHIHPLLGWRLKNKTVWENVLDPTTCSWLADHKVASAIVFPGAAYVEMALAAAREHFGGTCQELEELDILSPIFFDGEHARSLRFELSVRDGTFQIKSRQRLSEDEWALNAVGRLLNASTLTIPSIVIQNFQDNGDITVIDRDTHYQLTRALGLEYGTSFQGLDRAEVQENTLLADLSLSAEVKESASQYLIHPAILDACFQSLVDFFKDEIEAGHGMPLLPVKIGRLAYYADTPIARFRASLKRLSARSVLAAFELLDAAGQIVAVLTGCRFRAASLQRRSQTKTMFWKIRPHLKLLEIEQMQCQLPGTQEFNQHLHIWFAEAEGTLQRDAHFKGELPLFDALSVSFAKDAFQALFDRSAEWMQQALNQPEIVDSSIRPFFFWLTRVLRQEGLLVEYTAGIWKLESSDLPGAQGIWRSLLRECPASLPELVLAASVGRNLAAVLSGEINSSSLAKRLKLSHQAETLYDESQAYLGTRLAVQEILRIVARDWPSNRRLRVLEIVAGTSGVLLDMAGDFPEESLDYVIAHADDDVRDRLQTEYIAHSYITVAKIEEEQLRLSAEATLPEHFDVIIFRHSLHGMPHPVGVLAAARQKLASGGLLVLAERHPDLIADFVSGIDTQWWRENSGGEPVSPLMSPKVWEHTLREQGFVDIDTFRELPSENLAEGTYLLFAKRSKQENLRSVELPVATWLLSCDSTGRSYLLADRLRLLLESQGQQVMVAMTGDTLIDGQLSWIFNDPASITGVQAQARAAMGKIENIVHLGMPADSVMQEEGTLPESERFADVLHIVRAMGHTTVQPRLWLVTTGGALVEATADGVPGNPEQGALWGLGRVIMNEYPTLGCTLIDLDIDLTTSTAAMRLQTELLQPDGEKEIVLTADGRFVLRMERALLTANQEKADEAVSNFRLDFHVPGQLRNLVWLPLAERSLADDEIEVRVIASGLNFRDVMYLMGLLPDEAVENGFAGASLGLEFAGVVTSVGKRAAEFEVGDAVMGFGSACFASHVVTKANAVTHKPADWSFEAAATVPTVFFTVYYALKHLADLQPGERVLIHGAGGGVGIAAVQLAQYLGAEVFATAGSDEKRDFVKLLGADHVLDSRSLAFADEILAITGGEGVDVILNSLAGEAIRRNLGVLKPFGRFLELGKRDFFENTPIGLRPFKDNISYFGIDADQLLIARPELAALLFREVMILFRDGILFPLPYRVFPADRVVDAFRTMQQSRHIGKVVIKLDGARVPVETIKSVVPPLRFEKNTTWLVTGGISGFGLESARWLAERGVGCLVLIGRRGKQTPGAAEAVKNLEALGARVKVVACDITDRAAVQSMLMEIRPDCPPVTGILHAAMVLDDALIANLDSDRLNKVLAPKMQGAWNLHSLTLDIPLEHFILYSSVATFIGNPGQANYVAANASLESLAAMRRSMGLPATCIGWGPISDAGYLTRNQAVKDSLTARVGAAPLSARDALAMLDSMLPQNSGTIAVADLDWPTISRLLPSAKEPRFEVLRRQAGPAADAQTNAEDIYLLIAGKTPEEVRNIVQTKVLQTVAEILCIGTDRIDPARSLLDLGMDSLMSVELALGLEQRFGIQLPAMMLNEGPTVERVSQRLTERILGANDKSEQSSGDQLNDIVTAMAAQHGEEISAEDLAQAAEQVRDMKRTGTRLIP